MNDRRKTVFLDRDGVINQRAREHCYIFRWEDFRFLPGAVQGIRMLNEAGYLVFVTSNQRGIARGLYTLDDVQRLHEKVQEALRSEGARIDGFYICPHEDGCSCRKPKPGLLWQAMREHPVDEKEVWMVGDQASDIKAGLACHARCLLISEAGEEKAYGQEAVFATLKEACAYITGKEKQKNEGSDHRRGWLYREPL